MPSPPPNGQFHALAFGLRWQSDLPLPPYASAGPGNPDITVAHADYPLPAREAMRSHGSVTRFADGFRYSESNGGAIDLFGANSIEYRPVSPAAALPHFFFGTVTGLLLAWRGLIPIHGSAVELDGRGFLICGPAGAGKSTMTAALIARGARLISDDLSVLHPTKPGDPLLLYPGRTTLRLHADTAMFLSEAVPWSAAPYAFAGKQVDSPPRADAATPIPLAALVLTGSQPQDASNAAVLEAQFFRPFWTRRFLGTPQRRAQLHFAARSLAVHRSPACPVRDRQSFHDCGTQLAAFLRGLPSA